MNKLITCSALYTVMIGTIMLLQPAIASAQRDYFTTEEIELIRDAQQIDKRIEILTKTIDRRLIALNANLPGESPSKKDVDKWGPMPEGTRQELLFDIKRILQKAIDDIDNLAERPDSAVADPNDKKPKPLSVLFPKAVRILAGSAANYRTALKSEFDKTTNKAEQGLIATSVELCDEIIASVAKLPADVKKKKGD